MNTPKYLIQNVEKYGEKHTFKPSISMVNNDLARKKDPRRASFSI